ncbi:MAG: DUF1579 family protein [Polyangiaceae bacterium]|nr:DUF1579 family protein [Polyangiaceae bacterium]
MSMPEPTPAHAALAAFAGRFVGEETLHPSPWDPEGGRAVGHLEARMALGGLCLVSDYREERAGRVVMEGHGVYGYEPGPDLYVMTWVDSAGGGAPVVARGRFEGGTLTYLASSPRGESRYVYRPTETGYHFRIELRAPDAAWRPFLEASYRRV